MKNRNFSFVGIIALILVFWASGVLRAQSFFGPGAPIPDHAPGVWIPLQVSGLSQNALNATLGLQSVCVDISHTYDRDLRIYLVCPDYTFIELSTSNGGSGNNYQTTCFSDNASTPVTSGSAPFNGTYRPEGPLYWANNGQNPNGLWHLYVQDNAFPDSGVVNFWNINFGPGAGVPPAPITSNLPIIKINTLGSTIVDDPKIKVRLQVIDNGPGNRNSFNDTSYVYNGWAGAEYRGSYSQTMPKKSIGLETQDSAGNSVNVSLFGMPTESDWILNASYSDKTFMRNALSYDLFRKMGRYASRTQHAEVFVNNQYRGMYIFCEKIKRDSGRVNISKLTPADTAGISVTGGYILKIDKPTGSGGGGFSSAFPPVTGGGTPYILYDYPEDVDLMPQQATYIQAYVDSFEQALHSPQFTDSLLGYRKFADVNSFIDYFLLDELTRNVDNFRISSYFYKPKITRGNKLVAGPVWDYDIGWGNANYYNGNLTSGWSYQLPDPGADFHPPFWWDRFLQDPYFRNNLRCRYNQLRTGPLATTAIHAFIDSLALYLNEGQQRNFQTWQILGIYVWPNPNPIPANYAGEIAALKSWVSGRLTWLDANLPGVCSTTGLAENNQAAEIRIYPNPASNRLYVYAESGMTKLRIVDVQGRLMHSEDFSEPQAGFTEVQLGNWPAGVYLVEVMSANGLKQLKLVKE